MHFRLSGCCGGSVLYNAVNVDAVTACDCCCAVVVVRALPAAAQRCKNEVNPRWVRLKHVSQKKKDATLSIVKHLELHGHAYFFMDLQNHWIIIDARHPSAGLAPSKNLRMINTSYSSPSTAPSMVETRWSTTAKCFNHETSRCCRIQLYRC